MRVRIWVIYISVAVYLGVLAWSAATVHDNVPWYVWVLRALSFAAMIYVLMMNRERHRRLKWIQHNTDHPRRDWWGWARR